MKRSILFIYCLFSITVLLASDEVENTLREAEQSCNVDGYLQAISSSGISQKRKNESLIHVIQNCSCSGSLNKLVQSNIRNGGQATDSYYFKYIQCDAPHFVGYDSTALGFLARQNIPAQDESITQDIGQTVKTLLDNGTQADTGLLDACYERNVPVAQALIKFGADPDRLVSVDTNQWISAMTIALHKISMYENFRDEANRKAKASLPQERFPGDPRASSVDTRMLELGQKYHEESMRRRAFVELIRPYQESIKNPGMD